LLFGYIWLRGSLPRVRYDQLMAIGWKILIPVSIVWILLIASVRAWRLDTNSKAVLRLRLRHRAHRGAGLTWDAARRNARCVRGAACGRGPGQHRRGRPGRARFRCRRLTCRTTRRGPRCGSVSSQPPALRTPPLRRSQVLDFLNPIKGSGHFSEMFKKVETVSYPEDKRPTAPRFHGHHQLNRWPDGLEKCIGCELCAWACPATHLRRGPGQHDRRPVLPGRAVRSRLPDQLPALHPVRHVHRGVPDPRADHDQRVRDRRRQPGKPDLDQGAAARALPKGWRRRHPMRLGEDEKDTTGSRGPRDGVPGPGMGGLAARPAPPSSRASRTRRPPGRAGKSTPRSPTTERGKPPCRPRASARRRGAPQEAGK